MCGCWWLVASRSGHVMECCAVACHAVCCNCRMGSTAWECACVRVCVCVCVRVCVAPACTLGIGAGVSPQRRRWCVSAACWCLCLLCTLTRDGMEAERLLMAPHIMHACNVCRKVEHIPTRVRLCAYVGEQIVGPRPRPRQVHARMAVDVWHFCWPNIQTSQTNS